MSGPDADLNPDAAEVNGIMLDDADLQALRTIRSGSSVSPEMLAWLEEGGLVAGGRLTDVGTEALSQSSR